MCYVFARLQLNKKVPRQQAPQAVFFADKLRMGLIGVGLIGVGLIGVGLIGQVCRRWGPARHEATACREKEPRKLKA